MNYLLFITLFCTTHIAAVVTSRHSGNNEHSSKGGAQLAPSKLPRFAREGNFSDSENPPDFSDLEAVDLSQIDRDSTDIPSCTFQKQSSLAIPGRGKIVSGEMFMEFFCRALHRGTMTLAIGDNIQNDAKRYMGITGMVHYNGQPATTETLPGKWAYYLDIPRWQFVTCQRFGAQWKNCATETPLFLKVAGVEQIQFWFWEYFDKTISKKVSKIHVFLLWRNGPMDSDQKFKFKFEGFVDHAKMKIDPLFVQVRRTTKSNIKEAFGTDKFISSWSSFLRLKEKEKKKSEISKMLHQYVFDEFVDTAMVPGEESDLPVLQEENIKESMVMANPYANGEMILHD